MLAAGGPILLSTGMSTYTEIGEVVTRLRSRGAELALFQCTTRYPVSLDEVGLNVIDELRQRFKCPAGLSDHSGRVYPALAAMAQGADMIEAHIVFDKRMFGPDTLASLTVQEFKQVAQARDAFAQMLRHPVDKDRIAGDLAPTRAMFGKSVALAAQPARRHRAGARHAHHQKTRHGNSRRRNRLARRPPPEARRRRPAFALPG